MKKKEGFSSFSFFPKMRMKNEKKIKKKKKNQKKELTFYSFSACLF